MKGLGFKVSRVEIFFINRRHTQTKADIISADLAEIIESPLRGIKANRRRLTNIR